MQEKIDKAIEFLAEEIIKQHPTNFTLPHAESILNLVRAKETLYIMRKDKENSEKDIPSGDPHDEPVVEFATIKDAVDYYNPTGDLHEELHIECRMSDGQEGVFIIVDSDFPNLAKAICDFLNGKAK